MKRRDGLKAAATASVLAFAAQAKAAFVRKPAAPVTFGSKRYQQIVHAVRDTFPSPTKDSASDSRFSRLFAEALGIYDRLKSRKTFIGKRLELDYKGAKKARLPNGMGNARTVIQDSAKYLEGIFTWSHPDVHRLHGSATAVSIIGQFYGALVDANLVWDDLSHRVAEAEVKAISMCAALVGYDPEVASGVFTFGGTGTTFYGIKIGLETAQPGAFQHGVKQPMRVFSSDVAHYASLSSVAWTGLGTDAAVSISSDEDNSINVGELEKSLRQAITRGEKIAAIVVTMGTTDSFGVDNMQAIHALRARLVAEYKLDYIPHIHADAVIGWSYCVFNDYDFSANPLEIPPDTSRSLQKIRERMQHLALADSVGIDFHKSGYTPYMSSLFLVKDAQKFSLIRRDKALMPYLFQFGEYDPGIYTLECSRSGGPVLSALANLEMLGKDGYRGILSHSLEMAHAIKRRAASLPWVAVANNQNDGAIAVLRVYPDGMDAQASYAREIRDELSKDQLARVNTFNKKVYDETRRMAESGESPVFVETTRYRKTAYGESIVGIKCFTLSIFTDPDAVDNVFTALEAARKAVMAAKP
ncbi:MAG: pyridoxal-dependent decarboxylase [Polaromonas sp.]